MRFEAYLPDELHAQLERCGNLDRIAPAMLSRAAPYLQDSIRKRARQHDQTGSMSRSVKVTKPKKSKKTGNWAVQAKFTGYDKSREPTPGYPRGVPNAVKAAGIEYGGRGGAQQAQPFLDAAAKDAEPDVLAALQRGYNDEVDK